MIPVKMTEHIRTQTLLMKREDLTYDKLRQFIVDYCQHVAPLTATPMDISALSIRPTDYSWYTPESGAAAAATAHNPSAQWPRWSQKSEPLDSFGKAPKGGAESRPKEGKHVVEQIPR